jgi:ferrous iron transport protein A
MNKQRMRTAADMVYGEKCIISEVDSTHPSSRRILEIGFTPGQEIELINKSIFNDPLAFSLRGTLIAIRKNEAGCIKLA